MAEGLKPGFTARSAGSREREKEAERIMNLDSVDLGMRAALSGLVPAGVSVCAVHACAPRREEERDLAAIQGPLKCPWAARISREAVPYLCVHQCFELHRVMHHSMQCVPCTQSQMQQHLGGVGCTGSRLPSPPGADGESPGSTLGLFPLPWCQVLGEPWTSPTFACGPEEACTVTKWVACV